MFFIYQLLLTILLVISPFFILYRILKNKEHKKRFIEKFSITSKQRKSGNLIWFHGASVGEILSIIPIVKFYEKKKKIAQQLKEGREVTEREKIRVYMDNINQKFRHKQRK